MFQAMRAAKERSDIGASAEYQSFCSSVSLRRVTIRHANENFEYRVHDHGPRTVATPLVFLPPISGTADVFFRQLMPLGAEGFRCISIEYSAVRDLEQFVATFQILLDMLNVKQVHLVGASLGGFLAQKYAEAAVSKQRVLSLFLINAFTDTTIFKAAPKPIALRFLPVFMLKRLLFENLPTDNLDSEIAQSVDFILECIDKLSRRELLSRLDLNLRPSYVQPQYIRQKDIKITLLDVNDECVLSDGVKEELYKYYPEAKLAIMKDGGNFPYLSRSAEVNIFLKIHCARFPEADRSPRATVEADAPSNSASAPSEAPSAASNINPVPPSRVRATADTPSATNTIATDAPTPSMVQPSPVSSDSKATSHTVTATNSSLLRQPAATTGSSNAVDGIDDIVGDEDL